MKNAIIMTFDLEEFDLPDEFGIPISEEEKFSVTSQGLSRLLDFIREYKIRVTFFITSSYANRYKDVIKEISEHHEIASHSLSHSSFHDNDPLESRSLLEEITGKAVNGFRMPRFGKVDMIKLKQHGYKYDSSINPVFLPGRYNYLSYDRRIFTDQPSGLKEVPLSAVPFLRIPLFWLTFKNLPLSIYLILCRITLKKDAYLHLCFHPWEFADLEKFDLPWYIGKRSGTKYLEMLKRLTLKLQEAGMFMTITDYIESSGNRNR